MVILFPLRDTLHLISEKEDNHINKLLVTMRDIQKYKVLTEVIENRLTVREAKENAQGRYACADGLSQHQWLEHIPEKWWLIAMIDDATNKIPYAGFFPRDTLFANMYVIRRFIEIKG